MSDLLFVGILIGMALQYSIERYLLPRVAGSLVRHGWR